MCLIRSSAIALVLGLVFIIGCGEDEDVGAISAHIVP
jgi:hypothetical protein